MIYSFPYKYSMDAPLPITGSPAAEWEVDSDTSPERIIYQDGFLKFRLHAAEKLGFIHTLGTCKNEPSTLMPDKRFAFESNLRFNNNAQSSPEEANSSNFLILEAIGEANCNHFVFSGPVYVDIKLEYIHVSESSPAKPGLRLSGLSDMYNAEIAPFIYSPESEGFFEALHSYRVALSVCPIPTEKKETILVYFSIDNELVYKGYAKVDIYLENKLMFGRVTEDAEACNVDVDYIQFSYNWNESVAVGKEGGSHPVYLVRVFSVCQTTSVNNDTLLYPFRETVSDAADADDWSLWPLRADDAAYGLRKGIFFWATENITVNNSFGFLYEIIYTGNMIKKDGLSDIKMDVDISSGGNVAKVGGFTVKLVNVTQFHAWLMNSGIDLENRLIDVSVIFKKDGFAPTQDEMLTIFRGVVQETSFDNDIFSVKCVDSSFKRHKTLPQKVVTRQEFLQADEKVIGKPIPIIYGEFISQDFFPWCRFRGKVYSPPLIPIGANQFLVCSHPIFKVMNGELEPDIQHEEEPYYLIDPFNSVASINTDKDSWAYLVYEPNKGINEYNGDFKNGYFSLFETQKLDTVEYDGTNGRNCIFVGKNIEYDGQENFDDIKDGLNLYFNRFYKPDDVDLNGDRIKTVPELSKAISNPQNYYQFVQNDTIKFIYSFKQDLSDAFFNDKDVNAFGKISVGFSLSTSFISELPSLLKIKAVINVTGAKPVEKETPDNISVAASDGTLLVQYLFDFSENFNTTINPIVYDRDKYNKDTIKLDSLEISIIVNGGTIRVGGFGVGIPYVREDETVFTINNQKGRDYFNSKLQTRKPKTGNSVLETPAEIVESIFRDELNIDANESQTINDQSFDDLDFIRGNWKLAGAMTKAKNSIDIIKDICQNTSTIQLVDRNNMEKIVALQWPGMVVARQLPIITTDDGADFKVTMTALNKVYNEFYVYYRPDSVKGTLDDFQYATKDECSLPASEFGDVLKKICTKSQKTYRTVNRFEFKAEWVQKDETAKRLLKWFVQFLSFKRFVVKYKTMLNSIHWEIGDMARFDLPLIGPNRSENLNKVFVLKDISISPNKDSMDMTWEEIPEESVSSA